ncbi:hypothetical protein NDU88_005741 [Pleurodeles waltl]|uniref:CEP152 CEP63 binding coiled coil domain-containing protein n=1 Tax=Pleurodeles waltl TaxID=8319 RepID=A0AAV7TUT4_PLEWA|nr:hypothetical protein NDU88_005741 [Pleurodeles waltl]
MSLDFDSGALQTQHADEEEYDNEDYARDQELKQLLTDLPHDMLDDSRDLSSPELNSSDCSVNEVPSGGHQPWQRETSWNKLKPIAISQGAYVDDHSDAPYCEPHTHTDLNEPGHHFGRHLDVEKHTNGWSDHQSEDEEGSVYDINYSYPRRRSKEDPEGNAYDAVHDYRAEDNYQQSAIFHLPEDFQPYTNGLSDEFVKSQDELSSFPDIQRENLQHLTVPGYAKHHNVESFQVKYNPYQVSLQHRTQETRGDEIIEEMQKEFLNSGDNSADTLQIAQLQVLYKARGRQLEEMNGKLEESGREMRCLNHQLAMIKAEKDGLAMSLQESQKLFQNGKEREAQLEAQIKVLEANVQALTANEEQICKKLKTSEIALEDMQRQLIDLRRSDALKRAREQHESFISSLKQKNEEQLLQLQQKLDAANTSLQEQKERCAFLEDHVTQLERKQDEGKLEKNEIINRLTRSLEESQRQCANLLQTGTIQETTQLRFQIQQAQSSKIINENMSKALQEELTELKEQVALYESAAKLGVYLNGTCGEPEVQLSESYVDLGIQNVNWKKTRFHSTLRKSGPPVNLTKDEIIMELKVELERSLSSNKMKRNQVSQLQQTLKEHQDKIEELKKQLEKTERTVRDYEVRADSMEKHLDTLWAYSSAPNEGLNEDIQKLKNENLALQKQIENHLSGIEELTQKEESLKNKNQELCNEMRQMIEDFDRDKQDAIDRCERTYQQHHEDIKNHFQKELSNNFEAEKEQLRQLFEEQMLKLQARLHEKDQELTTVQECYITLCKEKDSLEDTLKNKMLHEFTETEQKLKELLLKEKEETIRTLMEKHQNELASARSQWLKDKEAELKLEVEAQVAIVKTLWQEEQTKVMEEAVHNTEKDWQQRLKGKVEEINKPVVLEHKNIEIQTEPNEATDSSSKEIIEELQLKLQNSLQEKEKAVRQAVLDLEIQQCENISKQVEAAVNNAHARWLQELTSLAEYKAAVRAEQEKWEQESKLTVANQISAVVMAAEEKWKKEHLSQLQNADNPLVNVKQKELEAKVTLLTREIESKNEEHTARLKAELAKARAEWNKEKQEEINKMHAQNEKDYRTFLDSHRNKINEVLAQAKEDFERQKKELLNQKKTEIKESIEQNRKQWVTQESKKLQQHEEDILISIQYFLDLIHLDLVKGSNDRSTLKEDTPTVKLSIQYQEKLMDCLRKACQEIVSRSLENAMQHWKKKNGVHHTDQRTGARDYHRTSHADEIQHKSCTREMKISDSFDIESDNGGSKINLESQADCCEHCLRELEKSRSECQELKSKLEKACRHLQRAVKEHKVRGEQIRENETIIEALKNENYEVQKTIGDMNECFGTSSSHLEGAGGNASCCGRGLEEMRSQYIIAVDKIRDDMLRYIQESRERAAEMLKAEVLRERQETARKMRKYYLICLQQLLKDDGKHEGAEKKIMNAASKLATMAKVLESPMTHKPHNRHAQSARSQNGEVPPGILRGANSSKVPTPVNGDRTSTEQSASKFITDKEKVIPHTTEPKLKGGVTLEVRSASHEEAALLLRNEKVLKDGFALENGIEMSEGGAKATEQNLAHSGKAASRHKPASCISKGKLQSMHAFTWLDGLSDSESDHASFQIRTKQANLKICLPNHLTAHAAATSERSPRFDIQETPVRDENRPNDWSLSNEHVKVDSSSMTLMRPVQKENSVKRADAQAHPCIPSGQCSAGFLSTQDESVDLFGRQTLTESSPVHATKKNTINCSNEHQSEITRRDHLHHNSHNLRTDFTKRSNSKPVTEVTKSFKTHSRRLLFDAGSGQQDSGFDSPLTNFNS